MLSFLEYSSQSLLDDALLAILTEKGESSYVEVLRSLNKSLIHPMFYEALYSFLYLKRKRFVSLYRLY